MVADIIQKTTKLPATLADIVAGMYNKSRGVVIIRFSCDRWHDGVAPIRAILGADHNMSQLVQRLHCRCAAPRVEHDMSPHHLVLTQLNSIPTRYNSEHFEHIDSDTTVGQFTDWLCMPASNAMSAWPCVQSWPYGAPCGQCGKKRLGVDPCIPDYLGNHTTEVDDYAIGSLHIVCKARRRDYTVRV